MEVNLISTFAEFKELKNIDRPTLMSVLEDTRGAVFFSWTYGRDGQWPATRPDLPRHQNTGARS